MDHLSREDLMKLVRATEKERNEWYERVVVANKQTADATSELESWKAASETEHKVVGMVRAWAKGAAASKCNSAGFRNGGRAVQAVLGDIPWDDVFEKNEAEDRSSAWTDLDDALSELRSAEAEARDWKRWCQDAEALHSKVVDNHNETASLLAKAENDKARLAAQLDARPRGRDLIQRAGVAAGLLAGSDIDKELVPAIHEMGAKFTEAVTVGDLALKSLEIANSRLVKLQEQLDYEHGRGDFAYKSREHMVEKLGKVKGERDEALASLAEAVNSLFASEKKLGEVLKERDEEKAEWRRKCLVVTGDRAELREVALEAADLLRKAGDWPGLRAATWRNTAKRLGKACSGE